jgi:hypothetical protein
MRPAPCLVRRLDARRATKRTTGRASRPGSALGSGPAMERLQPAPPSAAEEGTASIPSPPAQESEPVPVLERLAALREPGVTAGEVDAFLASLEAPFLPGESPRERADLMLDVLEEERLCELRGSDGRRVGLAALETLLRLGHPYVFDVTPEMLARARGAPADRWSARVLVGLGLTGVNGLLPVALFSEEYVRYLLTCGLSGCESLAPEEAFSGPALHLPFIVLVLLAPPVLSLLTRRRTPEAFQVLLTAVQVVVGLVCLFMALTGEPAGFWRLFAQPTLALVPGVLSLLTAFCLYPHEDSTS